MKEIHFYKDSHPYIEYPIKVNLYVTHDDTLKAINNKTDNIHTTAISALNFDMLMNDEYEIYIHEKGKSFKIEII